MGSDMELCFNVRTFFSTVYPFRSFLNRLIAANFLIRSIIRIGTRKWRLFLCAEGVRIPTLLRLSSEGSMTNSNFGGF